MRKNGLFALTWMVVLVGCGSHSDSTNFSSESSDGGTIDPASCGSQSKSEPLSSPCCLGYGVDACGAGLFCAAFDGRTQPTCYALNSRLVNQTCNADDECVTSACNTTSGKCKALPGTTCDPSVGCAPDPAGKSYMCGNGNTCVATGYGLVGQYCDGTIACQVNVGLTCDPSRRECVAVDLSTTNFCNDSTQALYRYGECAPLSAGSFDYETACSEVEASSGGPTSAVACPSGFRCETDVPGSFDFCQ